MATESAVTHDWPAIEAMLPADFNELAEEYGVIRPLPAHLNSKIKTASQLLHLILLYVASDSSLKTATAAASAGDIVDISHVGLHKRLGKSGFYLASLVGKMMNLEQSFERTKWAGYEVCLADATAINGKGGKGTVARVHYGLRLNDLKSMHVEVSSEKQGESFYRFAAEAGQLWIGDRGYGHAAAIAHTVAQGADVLVRCTASSLPLVNGCGERISVIEKVRTLGKAGRPKKWKARLLVDGVPTVAGRLVAVMLPPAEQDKACVRLAKEHGKANVTPLMLEMSRYVVVFTTVPAEKLSAHEILELYRLRWQIELHIKREKSIGELDRLPNRKPETIYAWLCAKLLLSLIVQRISAATGLIPPCAISGAEVAA